MFAAVGRFLLNFERDGYGGGWGGSAVAGVALVGALAVAYMSISTGLLTFNKYLMEEDRFPFAIFLGLVHMSASFGFNAVLYRVRPALFPSLSDPDVKVDIDGSLVVGTFLPIAVCFAAQLVLNNAAFMHSSLPFLQMMKESNVVLVYFMSLAFATEQFSGKRIAVLLFIIAATVLTIHGEAHLSYVGLVLQGLSIFCESLKLTLQSHTLSATGKRLDALTYVMVLAPLVFCVLGASLAIFSLLWPSRPVALLLPSWALFLEYSPVLFGNACLAFLMNVTHALFIKYSSAITFILTGIILKDVLIVVVGALAMGNDLTLQQVIGFSMQLVGVFVWSLLKLFPDEASLSMVHPTPPRGGWEALSSKDQDSAGLVSFPKQLSHVSSGSTVEPFDEDETPHSISSWGSRERPPSAAGSSRGPCFASSGPVLALTLGPL